MDDDSIAWMQKRKRLKLDAVGIIDHYSIAAILLFPPGFQLYGLCRLYVFHTYDGSDSGLEIFQSFLLWMIPSLCAYLIQARALRFREFRIKNTEPEFKEALKRTIEQLDWEVTERSILYTQAYKRADAWEEWRDDMITIIRTDNDILINSITLNVAKPWITAPLLNTKNARAFFQNLRDVIAGKEAVKKTDEKPEKEWTLGKILARVILYPMCIALIATSIFLLIPSSIDGAILGLAVAGMALTYLYSDISMIVKSRNNKMISN